MKKNIILYLILYIFTLSSCEDFLEEKSHDKIIPKSVEDYNEFLYGEAYLRGDSYICNYLDIMTDDTKSYAKASGWGNDGRINGYGYYAWQGNPELSTKGAINNDNAWGKFYHSILTCNIVLNDIEDASGSRIDKDDLKAEAHFIRAFSYFMLVNLYGEPYNKNTAATDLGVPISNVIGMEDIKFERESVAKVYEQINDDLEAAIELFLSSGKLKDIFKANLNATYLLASRVALYTEDWDNVIKYSNEVIKDHPALFDLNKMNKGDIFISTKNPEILFTYANYFNAYYASGAKAFFPHSDELYGLFKTGDLRKNAFIPKPLYFFMKSAPKKNDSPEETGVFGFAFRSAEAYLNRAEAFAQKKLITEAMKDLNKLRSNRFSTTTDLSASTQDEAIKIVRTERRIELCFEHHRWFDLRRYGCPRIEHLYMKDPKAGITEKYVLEEKDPAYTLPLPYEVSNYNSDIKNIERPDRTPLAN